MQNDILFTYDMIGMPNICSKKMWESKKSAVPVLKILNCFSSQILVFIFQSFPPHKENYLVHFLHGNQRFEMSFWESRALLKNVFDCHFK